MKNRALPIVVSVCTAAMSALSVLSACSPKAKGKFLFEDLGNEVSIHTEIQRNYLEGNLNDVPNSSVNGKTEQSKPNAVKLEWDFSSDQLTANLFNIYFGEDKNLKTCKQYSSTSGELELYNLKIGTTYYYKVEAVCDEQTVTSSVQSFTTSALAPRNLFIDGVTNSRDLGGKITEDGGLVRQGLIYRTAELNKSGTKNDTITAAGKKTMLEDLGVRTEIDLRGNSSSDTGGITASPLGDSVNYVYAPMDWANISNLMLGNCQQIVKIFHILADESNYPVFYHCRIGTDRTGMLSILINGLLGVNEEELYRDHLFSNFGLIENQRVIDSGDENSVKNYMVFIKAYQGNSLAEKTYNCLASMGVPTADLDSVISIMKEDSGATAGKAVSLNATKFLADVGLSSTTASSTTYTPELYYSLNGTNGKNLKAKITASEATIADVYVYAQTSNVNNRFNESVKLTVNGTNVNLSSSTFYTLGCRAAAKSKWIPIKLASVNLVNGENEIAISEAIAGKGIDVSCVTVVPENGRITA